MKTSISHAKPFYRLAALVIGAVMFVASAVPAGALNYRDLTWQPDMLKNPLVIDATPPSITDLQANPPSFNPTNDDTAISFNLNKKATVTIDIVTGTSTTPVKTIIQNASLASGYHTYYWGGKNSSDQFVKAGTYYVRVAASNNYGTDTERTPVIIYYDTQEALSIKSHYANPSIFDPTSASTTISYTLNKSAYVTVRIAQGSNTVKYLKSNSFEQSGSAVWDGKYSSGAMASEGAYTYEVYARLGNEEVIGAGNIIVQYAPKPKTLSITNHSVSPSTFDPNTQTTKVYYTLNKSAYVTVRIAKGTSTVKYLKSNSFEQSGSAVWDGKYSSGAMASEGTYTYEVYARLGNEEVTGAGNIIVQYATPPITLKITNHYANPSTFDPNTQTTNIFYTLNKSAYVTVQIKQDSNVVKIIQNSVYTSGGYASWNGKDVYGANVSEGNTYTYEIYATSGSQYASVAGNVAVDYQEQPSVGLHINNHYADPKTFDPYHTNTTVYFTLNQPAYVTIKIKSGWGTVKTIQTSSFETSGGATWDGRKSDGSMVSEGTYQYEINAYLDNANVTATGYITVDFDYPYDSGYAPYLTNISTNPDPFNPYLESTELQYTIKGGSAYVTIEVYDKDHYDNKLIDTLVNNSSMNTGAQYIKWDGKDYAGAIVKEGIYTFKIIVSNSHGSDTEYAEVEVDYDVECNENDYYCGYHQKPYIFNDYASPNPFKIGGSNETKVYFSLNTGAKVTVTILKDNNVIRSLQTDGYAGGGKNYVKWNGKDYKGNYVSVGTYMYKIYAENSYGTDIKSDYLYVTATVGTIIPCGGYNDIDISSPYCKAIIEMGKLGIFEGYSDGTFGAYNPINRAELVKVVLKALNRPIQLAAGSDAGFTDVNVSAWYMNYLYTARLMGVINGYPDGTFRPAKTVNKVEMLKIFLNSANTYLPECKYAPYKDTPVAYSTKWYLPFACYAKKYSLIDTDTYGNLNPAAPMKRGDVAELFYRYQMQNLFNKVTNPTMN